MEKIKCNRPAALPLLIGSFFICMGAVYSTQAAANTPNQTKGTQLAYYVVDGQYHYRHRYHYRNAYWTRWRYIGGGCVRSCLISRWNGEVIRCQRRCQ